MYTFLCVSWCKSTPYTLTKPNKYYLRVLYLLILTKLLLFVLIKTCKYFIIGSQNFQDLSAHIYNFYNHVSLSKTFCSKLFHHKNLQSINPKFLHLMNKDGILKERTCDCTGSIFDEFEREGYLMNKRPEWRNCYVAFTTGVKWTVYIIIEINMVDNMEIWLGLQIYKLSQ